MNYLVIFILLIIAYFILESFYDMYSKIWYYKKQGVELLCWPIPVIGSIHKLAQAQMKRTKYDQHPLIQVMLSKYGTKLPPVVLDFKLKTAGLTFSDPVLVNEIYTNKNKYFDKHDLSKQFLKALVGDGILFQKSNELWAKKRKNLSSAFYKEKLHGMLQIIIKQTFQNIKRWQTKTEDINISIEVGQILSDCIQSCVFGQQNLSRTLSYEFQNGQQVDMNIAQYLKNLFSHKLAENMQAHKLLLSIFRDVAITKQEKLTQKNILKLRSFFKLLINERRKELNDLQDQNNLHYDFLTILITDEFFNSDQEMMIDECLTFMLAATQTTQALLINMMYYLMKYPDINEKVRQEIKEHLKKQFNQIDKVITEEQWLTFLNQENLGNLTYTGYCLSETLRLEPSVPISTSFCFIQPTQIGPYQIRSDHHFNISMYGLHHNPEQWQSPEEFIPERFDPFNPISKTPSGEKRHPMSFGPFLGGKRICLGKTFAELIAKIVTVMIAWNYKFSFVDQDHSIRKPYLGMENENPKVMAKIHHY